MSRADQIFVEMCTDILENGISTEGEKVPSFGFSTIILWGFRIILVASSQHNCWLFSISKKLDKTFYFTFTI